MIDTTSNKLIPTIYKIKQRKIKFENNDIKEYNKRLETTIKHKDLGRKVSYQRLIRLEAYKLKKHLLGMKKYDPFVIWW